MPTTPRSQIALAAEPNFLKRLSSLLVSEALVKAEEPAPAPVTPPDPAADAKAAEVHAKRRQLAQAIITNPSGMAQSLALTITNSTNLKAAETTYNFEAFAIETAASDAAITSQIGALWNVMAGV